MCSQDGGSLLQSLDIDLELEIANSKAGRWEEGTQERGGETTHAATCRTATWHIITLVLLGGRSLAQAPVFLPFEEEMVSPGQGRY